MTKFLTTVVLAIAFVAPSLAQIRPATKKLPLTPDICGISGSDGPQYTAAEIKNIQRYCAELSRKAIAKDPGYYAKGRIEKADPMVSESASGWLGEGEAEKEEEKVARLG